jgi:hypothetical protein
MRFISFCDMMGVSGMSKLADKEIFELFDGGVEWKNVGGK